MHANIHSSTIVAKTWKQPKCPSADERIKKMWYYVSMKKDETMLFTATWEDLEVIILIEVNQRGKNKYDIIYMLNLKNDTNELIYKTDSQKLKTNLWLPREKEAEGIN